MAIDDADADPYEDVNERYKSILANRHWDVSFTAKTIGRIIDLLNTLNLDTLVPTSFGLLVNLLISILKEVGVYYHKCFSKVAPRLRVKIHYWSVQLTPRIIIIFSMIYFLITLRYILVQKHVENF